MHTHSTAVMGLHIKYIMTYQIYKWKNEHLRIMDALGRDLPVKVCLAPSTNQQLLYKFSQGSGAYLVHFGQ